MTSCLDAEYSGKPSRKKSFKLGKRSRGGLRELMINVIRDATPTPKTEGLKFLEPPKKKKRKNLNEMLNLTKAKRTSTIASMRINNLKSRSCSDMLLDYLIGRKTDDLELFTHGVFLQHESRTLDINGKKKHRSSGKTTFQNNKTLFGFGCRCE